MMRRQIMVLHGRMAMFNVDRCSKHRIGIRGSNTNSQCLFQISRYPWVHISRSDSSVTESIYAKLWPNWLFVTPKCHGPRTMWLSLCNLLEMLSFKNNILNCNIHLALSVFPVLSNSPCIPIQSGSDMGICSPLPQTSVSLPSGIVLKFQSSRWLIGDFCRVSEYIQQALPIIVHKVDDDPL